MVLTLGVHEKEYGLVPPTGVTVAVPAQAEHPEEVLVDCVSAGGCVIVIIFAAVQPFASETVNV